MRDGLLFVGLLSTGVAVYAVLTLPSWLFASMNRSTLWRLRDQTFDARRFGLLPDTAYVEAFIRHIETAIVVLPKITALQVWWLGRYFKRPSQTPHIDVLFGELPDGTVAAKHAFAEIQGELRRIFVRQYFVGSWSGLLLVVPRHFLAFCSVLRLHGPPHGGLPQQQRESEIVTEVAQVVPLIKRREKDVAAAAAH